jgi:electron transport complex protein RnfD
MKEKSPTKLVVETPPHVTGRMTKDLVMEYVFVALSIIAALSFLSFGFDSIIISVISVLVAVACDFLLSPIMGEKGPRNTMSAAVFGLIVAMSYSLGLPVWETEKIPLLAGGIEQYLYPALISAVGLIVFKKIQGLAGRKYVNPAAISKLLILGLLFLPAFSSMSALLPADHATNINLQSPLTSDIFGYYLTSCYGGPSVNTTNPYNFGTFENPLPDVLYTMLVVKNHGWIGGFSSILIMAVGIVLFAVCRGYIKWRITLTYLVITALLSVVFGFVYGGDIILRLLFHLFMGSSIFLAFFMATDPATTPLTHLGQIVFGLGLAILTMIIQVYIGFFGGSILALVIMNITVPLLDQLGVHKPFGRR